MQYFGKAVLLAIGAMFVGAIGACGEDDEIRNPAPPKASVVKAVDTVAGELEAAALPELAKLDTYIADSIEIDVLEGGPGDANLYAQAERPDGDPADQTAHALVPAGPGTFIDWNDFADDLVNHRLVDEFKGDASSFPLKNECVGQSQVLAKMDLTTIAAANNSKFAYFGVQRRDNNGDAGYYWLFTKKQPSQNVGEEPCKAGQYRLTYDISGPNGGSGDVLIVGQFSPSSGPLVRVFRAATDATGVPAGEAINYEGPLWVEETPEGLTAAINTTLAAPGALGAAGVDALKDGNLEEEIFAEAAVPLSIFTGESVCGASFFGSVITRPSGSGGTTPDLKDLAGPAVFNFGEAAAEAELRATCDLEMRYDVTKVLGLSGQPMPEESYSCSWSFFDANSGTELAEHPTTCEGIVAVPKAGNYRAEVVVTLKGDLACADTVAVDSIPVYAPLQAEAHALPTCDAPTSANFEGKAKYYGAATGGSGEYEVAWSFFADGCPTCAVDPTSSTSLWSESEPGSFDVRPAAVDYTAKLSVKDTRTDAVDANGVAVECTAEATDTAMPFAPIKVNLALAAAAQACPSDEGDPAMETDAVTYNAVYSGGDGSYTLDWTDDSCDGKASCTIDPDNSTFCADASVYVVVDDGSELCGAMQSETETYAKKTVVTASDN